MSVSYKKAIKHLPKNGALYCLIVLCVLFSVISSKFFTYSNFINICRQASVTCIITMCSFLAILTHQTDLSVGATASLTSVVAATLFTSGTPVPLACLVALAVGVAIGALNGVLCGYTTIPPFIITLGTMYIGESVGVVITEGRTLSVMEENFTWIGAGDVLGGIPIATIITVVLLCILGYILKKRPYGTALYAVGGNVDAALASGIRVSRIKLSVFIINGLLATVAGFILTSRLGSSNPSQGLGLELDGICAAILGGTALSGGKGSIWGAFLGALTLAALRNGLNIIGISSSVQMFLVGATIIIILALDSIRNRRK